MATLAMRGVQAGDRWLAVGFVTLSGAGFVGARLGLPHAEPFAFLALRFGIAAIILAVIALAIGRDIARAPRQWGHIVAAGLLTVGVFSAGVFYSIAGGVSPALSALIVALHPIVVAIAAPALLGERVGARQWLGLLLGLGGVFLVVGHGLALDPALGWPVACSFIGLFGMSAGNLYQKARCADMPLFAGSAAQCASCTLACGLGAAAFESGHIAWTGEFVVAVGWMSVVVSVGAVSILYVLIQRGEVSRVAGLFYLIPVVAALVAWGLFGQGLTMIQCLGMAVAGSGMLLVTRRPG